MLSRTPACSLLAFGPVAELHRRHVLVGRPSRAQPRFHLGDRDPVLVDLEHRGKLVLASFAQLGSLSHRPLRAGPETESRPPARAPPSNGSDARVGLRRDLT